MKDWAFLHAGKPNTASLAGEGWSWALGYCRCKHAEDVRKAL